MRIGFLLAGHSLSAFGMLRVKFKTGPRAYTEEEHSFIAGPLLKLTVENVMQSGDGEFKENLRPYNMALVSPRVFWSLIKVVIVINMTICDTM